MMKYVVFLPSSLMTRKRGLTQVALLSLMHHKLYHLSSNGSRENRAAGRSSLVHLPELLWREGGEHDFRSLMNPRYCALLALISQWPVTEFSSLHEVESLVPLKRL